MNIISNNKGLKRMHLHQQFWYWAAANHLTNAAFVSIHKQ